MEKCKQGEAGTVPHIWNPSTQEVEAGGLEAPGPPQLHSKSEASLGYTRTCFTTTTKPTTQNKSSELVMRIGSRHRSWHH